MSRGMLAFGLGVAVAAAACGDQQAGRSRVDAAAGADADGPDADETGALIVSGSGLTDAVGLTLIVAIRALPTPPGTEVGRVCEPVTVSPMAFRAIVRVPGPTAGCALGAPTVFADGPYSLGATVINASGTPLQCAFLHFTMPGPSELVLPAFEQCPGN